MAAVHHTALHGKMGYGSLRVLLFIEPVIFWNNPVQLAAHLVWARQLKTAIGSAGALALACNPHVCQVWASESGEDAHAIFPIDPYEPLAAFDWRRSDYTKALYQPSPKRSALTEALEAIRRQFQPDLVIASSQNAYLDLVFGDLPRFNIEQAPLPRHRQPFRTSFDPHGHQVGGLLNSRLADILSLDIPAVEAGRASSLIDSWASSLASDELGGRARDALRSLRSDFRVAILATQPPDWSAYEGAYEAIDLQGLLCTWEAQLPPGWIGVPTFHAGYRLPKAAEDALVASRQRLRALPEDLSQGLTEPLLTEADALVSISSTSSIAAMLLGKPVVTVGTSPFNALTGRTVAEIDTLAPISRVDAVRLLAFTTNRYSRTADQIADNPGWLLALLEQRLNDSGDGDWQLNMADWTAADAESQLFPLRR